MSKSAPPAYRALALQTNCRSIHDVGDCDAASDHMAASIERLDRQIRSSTAFIGSDCRLVVLPEYVLTGFPMGTSLEEWGETVAVSPDGPEYELLGEIAADNDIFLAGNVYERPPNFPDLFFQTDFVIDPDGDVILRYHRLHSMHTPTPFDVWDEYLEHHDREDVFPVVDTEIGRLATVASAEILYPELVRCLAMRGAEVLVHPTSEPYATRPTARDVARRARAIENGMYVVSANTAEIVGSPFPSASGDGGSTIVDYRGSVLTEAGQGETMSTFTELDLSALRRHRRRPRLENTLPDQRFDLYAESYRDREFYRPNALADGPVTRERLAAARADTVDRLVETGVFR
ncbi:nitrilase-related carbon-nitrogen hydrolase [Halovivax limisalsi]|uniref:nitrilase-related carbon-nitrogen hydrolase n=1 Tax=Halovivax limisalsi TaxID=1453760 RepID=UPI001FFC87B4|nr:nitrilase-related carbon-nitrogen hydrolase [Halovivax limisalsi]